MLFLPFAILAGLADLDGLAVLADLSVHAGLIRSEVYLSDLICTLAFIVMVFYRIKINQKVLIFPTVVNIC